MRDAATEAQVRAARPDTSVWLSANAGSGKTRVLTDRVARLLFDGVPPAHILCLTYTKAAASEMQNRLFSRLGEWAMLEDAPLRAALQRLGIEGDLPPESLGRARTLFALAIETPGGLRIQTIHSFCASLLRRFPLEAGISPQFTEIEDRAADLLRADILEEMSAGADAHLVAGVARFYTDSSLVDLCGRISGARHGFDPGWTEERIRASYDLPAGLRIDDVLADVFRPGELAFLAGLEPVFATGSANDQKVAAKLKALGGETLVTLEQLEGICLTGAGAKEPFSAKTGSIPTKALRDGPLAGHMGRLDDLALRVEAARRLRIGLMATERDLALHRFAGRFLPLYEAAKQARGWLDFDDLIDRTRALLGDEAVAAWVLYRLDGGIDHILVDEAQDTSPRQWQVIERLAQEFKAGRGARADIVRTIFVVGDKKQSIYSFQGADPGEFDRMCADFETNLRGSEARFFRMELAYSFRSAEPVLAVVDHTFEGRAQAGFAQDSKHRAFKDMMPGRVDLWPVIDKSDDAPAAEDDWFRPVDRVADDHHEVTLARQIARFIRHSIDTQAPIPVEIGHSNTYAARPARAGDFLILVRRRRRLFAEIIRACKQAGLPIAGADRLKVTAELAVRDLGALLSFLATPEDNHALAVALKSPLFGLDEQAIFDLAHRRPGPFLWPWLRDNRARFEPVLEVLDDLLGQTDFLRPYDLIERILVRHDGRRKLLGRLGEEAQDGIDALLSQALAYEQTEVPSLTGFLQWMTTDELEIKRQMDAAGDRIRVMTVHGSKGLEAPVVILPDCAPRRQQGGDPILADDDAAFWSMPKDQRPQRQAVAVGAAQAKREAEDDRLLYVAMTRAEKWLIVAASGEMGKKGDSWYERVEAGMDAAGAVPHDFGPIGAAQGKRLQRGPWDAMAPAEAPPLEPVLPALPEVFLRPAPEPMRLPETLTPSELGGAKALPGPDNADEDAAKRRGRLVHLLLEHLPGVARDDRESVAAALLATSGETVPDDEAAGLIAEVSQVLDAPDLGWIFAPDALAEVPVTAALDALGGRRFFGVIDRLIVTDDRIVAVDFKSNQTLPAVAAECPEAILRQMGAYAEILRAIYPGRRIETGIVWTVQAVYMPLEDGAITAALGRVSPP